MNIIQSCWSCGERNFLNFKAGWCAPEYHIMSYALSCLQLKQYFPTVILYTDKTAKKILIDTLKLPYDEVICDLDRLNNYHHQLFAIPKIHVYSMQKAPFLHVDSDVFIWKRFDDDLLASGLIAQNMEVGSSFYQQIFQSLEKQFDYFPSEIIEERKICKEIYAYNAGIIGGCDLDFFHKYAAKAKSFIENNAENLPKILVYNFNIFFEQYLFYCLAKSNKKDVKVLISELVEDLQYTGFGDFVDVPHEKQYLHLIGTYKRNKKVCIQMAGTLRQDYPEYYYRIVEIFKSQNVSLEKDYYHFLDQHSQKFLLQRYFKIDGNKQPSIPKIENHQLKNRNSTNPGFLDLINGAELIGLKKLSAKHLTDLTRFEQILTHILDDKFALLSKNSLYARDILNIKSFRILFKNRESYLSGMVVTDSINERIKSHFNWARLEFNDISHYNLSKVLEETGTTGFLTLVVPDCDQKGYSLVEIDEFDEFLLSICEKPVQIADLIQEAKTFFDFTDLQNSLKEFDALLLGRIKTALQAKTIKMVSKRENNGVDCEFLN